MRWFPLAAAALLLAGCSGDTVDPLFDDRLDVPIGSVGYVTVSLDKGETATWSWTSDRPIAFDGLLVCDAETNQTAPLATSGSGSFVADAHGCLADLVWLHSDFDVRVLVTVTGSGRLLESGVAVEAPNNHTA